jgi:MoxR-like ATPase
VTTVKPSQLRALLAKTIPAKEPVLISGAPGIGKTDIVRQACAEALAECVIMHPVVSDPTDFKGLPWVADGGATFLPFGELQQLINATKLTACFLDDLGQATPAVQAAAMQLILARHINGHCVSSHVVFLAATNRRGDRAGVSGILEPVKSRFATLLELAADLNDWSAWALSAGIAPEVIAFLRFRPALLSDFKPSADMTNSPSPRTWSAVSRLLALNLPRDLQVPTIEGAVGPEAAIEFVAFLRIWAQMVSPDVVLTSPDTAPIPSEPSALYALVTAIAMRVQSASMMRYSRYLERLVKDGKAEFAAVSLQTAVTREATLASTPGYIQLMSGPLGQLMIGGGVQ